MPIAVLQEEVGESRHHIRFIWNRTIVFSTKWHHSQHRPDFKDAAIVGATPEAALELNLEAILETMTACSPYRSDEVCLKIADYPSSTVSDLRSKIDRFEE